MQESIFRKAALPVALLSIVMMGIFAVAWFRDRNQVQTLVIATGGKSGQYYAFGKALANVVAKHQSRIRLEVRESDGALQNEQLLHEKKVDLALIQSDTPISPNVKAVSFLFPEMFHLIARKDVRIDDVDDLRGKRIALMPKGSGSYVLFWVLSKHYELDESKLSALPMSPIEAHAALNAGKVDALFRLVALGNESVAKLLQNPNLELVPIDQGQALQLSLPALEESEIPKGAYNGRFPIPPENLPSVAVRAMLMTRQDIKQDTIFEITRILYEARNDVVTEFPQAAMISEPKSITNLGFSFHPGAIAFYDEGQPSFIVTYSEPIGLLLSVSALCFSGVWQLRMWLKSKQKNRSDRYNYQLMDLIKQIDEVQDLEQLNIVRHQLLKMLEKVIIDLDKDLISNDAFQSFTFPLEVALASIRHRENLLMQSEKLSSRK